MDPFERGDCPPGLMIANPAALTNNLAFALLARALCWRADITKKTGHKDRSEFGVGAWGHKSPRAAINHAIAENFKTFPLTCGAIGCSGWRPGSRCSPMRSPTSSTTSRLAYRPYSGVLTRCRV